MMLQIRLIRYWSVDVTIMHEGKLSDKIAEDQPTGNDSDS